MNFKFHYLRLTIDNIKCLKYSGSKSKYLTSTYKIALTEDIVQIVGKLNSRIVSVADEENWVESSQIFPEHYTGTVALTLNDARGVFFFLGVVHASLVRAERAACWRSDGSVATAGWLRPATRSQPAGATAWVGT